MNQNSYKVATTLASPVLFSKEGTIEKVCAMTRQAAEAGAKLIVFPETYVPGYPWWIWMGINNNKKLELFKKQYDNALELCSGDMDYLRNTARQAGVIMALGYVERDRGTLYNSQVLIDANGEILLNRRKLMPTGEERTIWGMGDATSLKVCETELGIVGMLICYEHSMPLARYTLYGLGEQIHIGMWPGANFRSQPRDRKKMIDVVSRCLTFEGQVFTIFSSSCVGDEELAFYLELDQANQGILEPGGGISGIVNPVCNYLAGPVEDTDQIIYAEINLDEIVNVKHMVDCVGHYSRADIFELSVFQKRHQPVRIVECDHESISQIKTLPTIHKVKHSDQDMEYE